MRTGTEIDNLLSVYLRSKFPRDVKRRALDEVDNTCQGCGERVRIRNGGKGEQNIQPHHRLAESQGGADTRVNLVPLCSDSINGCHHKWDRLAQEKGIIFPGIPIEQAPSELIGDSARYNKALRTFGRSR